MDYGSSLSFQPSIPSGGGLIEGQAGCMLAPPGDVMEEAAVLWAREEAAKSGSQPIEALASRYGLSVDRIVRQLGALLAIPTIDGETLAGYPAATDVLPLAEASRRACIAVRGDDGQLLVALANPFDADTQAYLDYRIDQPFTFALAAPGAVSACLAAAEQAFHALDGVTFEHEDQSPTRDRSEDLSIEGISDATSPVVQLVNATLHDAIKAQASDVHLETTAGGLTVKYRLDGVLVEVRHVAGIEAAERAISRIKVMSELDIAERRVPQDGRFRGQLGAIAIDFRVSIMPSIYGEDAVIRILDKRALADSAAGLTLDRLGFESGIIETVRDLAALPYGMLLVTGPTGSGKTTTLYAVLSETRRAEDKIVTIEDPVEHQLSGILQIPVNERKGLTFARGLRSILRHDPDRIMVGEIRDTETAEISIQAALTGHLVYTTVHANNVLDVLGRFVHMGVDTYNFASAVNGVLAQRLLRKVCPSCSERAEPDADLVRRSSLPEGFVKTASFVRGRGCERCRGTGYRGRRAIGELLMMSDEMREAIVARESVRALKEQAATQGTRSLRAAALDLVLRGETTLEEANRVTFAIQ